MTTCRKSIDILHSVIYTGNRLGGIKLNQKVNITKYIADELRSLRAKEGLTLTEMSIKSGINRDTISRYENNTVSMQIWVLLELLKIYQIGFDIFFKNIYDRMQIANETKKEIKTAAKQ